MFKDNKTIRGSEYHEASIYMVEDGEKLFRKHAYAAYLDALFKVTNIKKDMFDQLYKDTLINLAQFLQSLHIIGDANEGRLLERSLRRSYGFIRECAPKVMANDGFGFDPDRLNFALYTAALLHGVGRVCQDRLIVQCDSGGKYKNTWYPVCGAMTTDFYKVRAIKSLDEEYVKSLHTVYAQVMMPSLGMAWLMEDDRLFLLWQRALEDLQTGFGELEIDLNVDKLAKDVEGDFELDHNQVAIIPPDTLEAEKFLAWLKEQINNNKLASKDASGLHNIKEGLLVELEGLIEQYANESGSRTKVARLKEQFLSLGVAGASAYYSKKSGGSFLGGGSSHRFEAHLIDRDIGLFESSALGPVVSVASQAQISSGERFFTRIGGLAQQFMLGHTSTKK